MSISIHNLINLITLVYWYIDEKNGVLLWICKEQSLFNPMVQLGFYTFCVLVAHVENSQIFGEHKSVSVGIAGIRMV